MLGFANAAEESLATKMASTPAEVLAFLRDLIARAKPVAQRELDELRDVIGRPPREPRPATEEAAVGAK